MGNLLDGALGLDQGHIRLTNLKTGAMYLFTDYASTLTTEISERPTGEDQAGGGPIPSVGRKPSDKLTIRSFYTKGETSAPHGDIYRDVVYPDAQSNSNRWLVEWTKDNDDPFANGSTGWSTAFEYSRNYHCDVPGIDFGSSNATPVEMKFITSKIRPVTFPQTITGVTQQLVENPNGSG